MYDEVIIGNPYLIQTIELLKYLDLLKDMKDDNLKDNKIDKLPELKIKSTKLININKYTDESIDELCKKTIILLITHAGYHNVDQECFELLTDLFKSYFKNLTSLFRKKLDQQAILNKQINLIKSKDDELLLLGKVFNELGLSFNTFQKFNYQLISYRDHLLKQINDLKIELKLPIDQN